MQQSTPSSAAVNAAPPAGDGPACPLCGNTLDTWEYTDPWTGAAEVVCECVFGLVATTTAEGA